MATEHTYDFRGVAKDPDLWIVIPEFNVSPDDVNGRGFERYIRDPEIDGVIQGSIWNVIGSMRYLAKGRFDSLADLYAAKDRVLASGHHPEKGTDDEWFAWNYVYIFEALERWHHIHPFNKLDGSVLLADIADTVLCLFSGGQHDPKSIGELRSQFAKKGAMTKLVNSPKQHEKQLVRQRWEEWQARPVLYKGKAEFARHMLSQYKSLDSADVIARWCRKWSDETD